MVPLNGPKRLFKYGDKRPIVWYCTQEEKLNFESFSQNGCYGNKPTPTVPASLQNKIWFSNKNIFEHFWASWKRHSATRWRKQRGMDSYWQWQISQSDCEINCNCGKITNRKRGVYSYRQRYASAQLSKCFGLTRRSTNFGPLRWSVPRSIRVHTTLNQLRFVLYHNIKRQRKKSLSRFVDNWKHWLRLECTRCIMQMSYLYASDFPFKTFAKSLNMQNNNKTDVWEKSNDAFSLSIRVQTTKNHIQNCFFTTISSLKKMFFVFRARADASSVIRTLIDNGKLANQIARLAAIVVKKSIIT